MFRASSSVLAASGGSYDGAGADSNSIDYHKADLQKVASIGSGSVPPIQIYEVG